MSVDIGSLFAGFGTSVSAIAIFYLARQVADGRRFVKAQLLNSLEAEFGERHFAIHRLLLPDAPWGPSGPGLTSVEDELKLMTYLQFFEKLALILETRALDLRTIDRLFAFRFFVALNNPHTAELVRRHQEYWASLISLHARWAKYRASAHLPEPYPDHRFRLLAAETLD